MPSGRRNPSESEAPARDLRDVRAGRRFARQREARRKFLTVAAAIAPEVLRTLATLGKRWPKQVETLELVARRDDLLATAPHVVPAAFTATEHEKLAALDAAGKPVAPNLWRALDDWATRWHLDVPWVRTYAIATLAAWQREPWRRGREWWLAVFELRSRDVRRPREAVRFRQIVGGEAARWDSAPVYVMLYNSASESRGAARKRMIAAIDAHLPPESGPRDRDLDRNLGWLVSFQVLRKRIAEIRRAELPSKVTGAAIKQAIKRTADFLGLPLRTSDRGRRPSTRR